MMAALFTWASPLTSHCLPCSGAIVEHQRYDDYDYTNKRSDVSLTSPQCIDCVLSCEYYARNCVMYVIVISLMVVFVDFALCFVMG